MFHLMLNRFSWQCLNISLDVSTDPSLKWCSSNWAALIPFGWLLNQGWVPREALLIPLPNASTTSPSSYTKLRYIKLYQIISNYIIYTIHWTIYYILIPLPNAATAPPSSSSTKLYHIKPCQTTGESMEKYSTSQISQIGVFGWFSNQERLYISHYPTHPLHRRPHSPPSAELYHI